MGIFSKKDNKKEAPAKEEKAVKAAPKAAEKKASVLTADQTQKAQAASVLLKPIVTEKSTSTGTYQFKVAADTNKSEVKKAFAALYGKTPVKVNIMNVGGKAKRFGRQVGRRADWKKAIVYLSEGETVDIFAS